MKKLSLLSLILVGLLFPTHLLAEANHDADKLKYADNLKDRPQSQALTIHDVSSIQVARQTGTDQSRIFRRTRGYEERVIRKVIKWINTAIPSQQAPETEVGKAPIVLKLNMDNETFATLEPAYNCNLEGVIKTCSAADEEIVFTRNNEKKRIKSQALYDWLMVGWKLEVDGPPKEELLEETLYTRYFSVIGKEYPDFIMCPRIDSIERIKGDTRRHLVTASALNYAGHHAPSYDRIIFTLIDTPEDGIKIIKIKELSNISEEESLKQCRWFE